MRGQRLRFVDAALKRCREAGHQDHPQPAGTPQGRGKNAWRSGRVRGSPASRRHERPEICQFRLCSAGACPHRRRARSPRRRLHRSTTKTRRNGYYANYQCSILDHCARMRLKIDVLNPIRVTIATSKPIDVLPMPNVEPSMWQPGLVDGIF
jgi:hypothetical protein